MEIDLEQLRNLMEALNEFELSELEIEQGQERIVLRRGGGVVAPVAMTHAASIAPPPPAAAGAAAAPAAQEDGTFITSPFVGTFYSAPSPDADPFVSAGKNFSAGSTLCIVEAMKLMNEIEAEFSGEILEVLVENGKPVEYGDRLFRVKKS